MTTGEAYCAEHGCEIGHVAERLNALGEKVLVLKCRSCGIEYVSRIQAVEWTVEGLARAIREELKE
jgi:hypothetical protein